MPLHSGKSMAKHSTTRPSGQTLTSAIQWGVNCNALDHIAIKAGHDAFGEKSLTPVASANDVICCTSGFMIISHPVLGNL